MIRKLKISGRMIVLIAMMFILVVIVGLVYTFQFNRIKNFSIEQIQEQMFEDQRMKIEVATHSMALSLGNILNDAMSVEMQEDIIRNAIDDIRFEDDESGYFFAYRGTVVVALPILKDRIGDDLGNTVDPNGVYFVRELYEQASRGYGLVEYIFEKPGFGLQPKISYAQMIPGTGIWIGTGVYIDNIEAKRSLVDAAIGGIARNSNVINILIISLVLLLVVLPISIAIRQSISKPLDEAILMAQELANGDLTASINDHYEDEVGQLNKAMKQMADKLKEILSNVMNASDNIASASQQMSSSTQQLSQGSNQQASSAEEVSSSMEQMAANIQQNTDNARETEKIAKHAEDGIQESSHASDQAATAMKDIAGKISIIGEISRQTNILALNAAVEAARAGEHGKGFAVVAAEVRKLAERSQVAANEIDKLSKFGVEISEEAGRKLSAIVPEIQKTASLVREIAAASIEQNSGSNQVNSAIQLLNQVTQQNAAASEEMATNSEELAAQADQLLEMVAYFKIDHNSKIHSQKQSNANMLKSHKSKNAMQGQKRQIHQRQDNRGVRIDMGNSRDNEYEKF